MNIVLFADSRWRDSFGLALTKIELQDAIPEANVWVIPFDLWQQALDHLNPDVAILNHLFGARNNRIASHVKRNGGNVYVMPTEGRPDKNKPLEFIASQKDSPYLDMFFSWNIAVADAMGDKAVVTGCPRFQIYQQPYRSLIESRDFFCEKYALDKSKKIVGVTTNFPQAKFHLKNQAFNRQDWKDIGISDKIDRLSNPDQYARSEYEKLEQLKGWIHALVAEYRDTVEVVLKPHPLEDVTMWEKFCDVAGVTLVKGEYIFNFVNACDVVVVREDCMTAQDAWYLDKPTIHVDFEGDESVPSVFRAFCAVDLLDDVHFILEESDGEWGITGGQEDYLDSMNSTEGHAAKAIASYVSHHLPIPEREKQYDYPAMMHALKQYDTQHYVPHFDYLGHYGKHVTGKVVREWERGIRDLQK